MHSALLQIYFRLLRFIFKKLHFLVAPILYGDTTDFGRGLLGTAKARKGSWGLEPQVNGKKRLPPFLAQGVSSSVVEEARHTDSFLNNEGDTMIGFLKTRMTLKARLATLELELKNRETDFLIKQKELEASHQRTLSNSMNDLNNKMTNQRNEMEQLKIKLTQEFDLKKTEITTMTKLEAEQKIAAAQLEADKKVNELTVKHANEISELKSAHAKDLNDKLTQAGSDHNKNLAEAFKTMNTEGGVMTKNLHEMSMKLLETSRQPQVNESRFLTGNITNPTADGAKTVVQNKDGSTAAIVNS